MSSPSHLEAHETFLGPQLFTSQPPAPHFPTTDSVGGFPFFSIALDHLAPKSHTFLPTPEGEGEEQQQQETGMNIYLRMSWTLLTQKLILGLNLVETG